MENKILTEAAFAEGIGDIVSDKIRTAGNMAAAFAGSQRAVGRLDRNKVSTELNKAWRRYAGRHDIKQPTFGAIQAFLKAAYGIILPVANIEQAEKQAEKEIDTSKPEEKTEITSNSAAVADALAPEPKNESVVNEASPNDAIVDLRKFFNKLANILIDQGLVDVMRNGKLSSGRGDATNGTTPPKEPTKPKEPASKGAGDGTYLPKGGAPAAVAPETPAAAEPETAETDAHSFDFAGMNKTLGDLDVDLHAIDGARGLARGDWDDFRERFKNLPKGSPEKQAALRVMYAALRAIGDR